jgi:hypothetical protein
MILALVIFASFNAALYLRSLDHGGWALTSPEWLAVVPGTGFYAWWQDKKGER